MILDFRSGNPAPADDLFDSEGRCLYEVTDAATGEPIDDLIFYADDERGVYRRHRLNAEGSMYFDPAADAVAWEEVRRPIRIVARSARGEGGSDSVPRLERLCASLRSDLAAQGISADDIPEPVLGALATFQERLERLERRVSEPVALTTFTDPGRVPPPITLEQIRETIERVNREAAVEEREEWFRRAIREDRPWTRADLARFLPEVRAESVTSPDDD